MTSDIRAYVIGLDAVPMSTALAERCIASGAAHGIEIEYFPGTGPEEAISFFEAAGLRINENRFRAGNKIHTTKLNRDFKSTFTAPEAGCFASHFRLWNLCVALNEPIIILEHDALIVRPLNENFDFRELCVLYHRKASYGKLQAGTVLPDESLSPGIRNYHYQRFASTVGYAIKPACALKMIRYACAGPVCEVDHFFNIESEDGEPPKDLFIERHDPAVVLHDPPFGFSTIECT